VQFEKNAMNVITPAKPKAKISAEEMERRREAVRQADASNRIEGRFPTPERRRSTKNLSAAKSSWLISGLAFRFFIRTY
jgi:hypothetical protein